MVTFTKSAAPSNWLDERTKLDGNWDIADSRKDVLDITSNADQAPTELDTPQEVQFGTGAVDANFVSLSGTNGSIIQFDAQRVYVGRVTLQPRRTTGGQEAHLVFQGQVRANSGTAWGPTGQAVVYIIDNQNWSTPQYIPIEIINPAVGVQFRLLMARASTNFGGGAGQNNGGLGALDVSGTTGLEDFVARGSARIELAVINENGSTNLFRTG